MDALCNLIQQQNALLQQIAMALSSLQSTNQEPSLGFTATVPTAPQWIFVSRKGTSCWYRLSPSGEPEIISDTALTGYIVKIETQQVIRKGEATDKLNITLKADRTYILSTGRDTHFAKSLLNAIAIAPRGTFSQPVTISVAAADDDSIVWARLYAPNLIKVPREDQIPDSLQALTTAIAALDRDTRL